MRRRAYGVTGWYQRQYHGGIILLRCLHDDSLLYSYEATRACGGSKAFAPLSVRVWPWTIASTSARHFHGALPSETDWLLRGVVNRTRYTNRDEQNKPAALQSALGRMESTCVALIPTAKSAVWWALSQDGRWESLATRSVQVAIGLRYLPAARRLHHSCELGEPFDFLVWFEFAPTAILALHSSDFGNRAGVIP